MSVYTTRCFRLPSTLEITLEEALEKKIVPPDALEAYVKDIREKGLKIATLNGSFDLMHAGHLHMIFEAKKQADILIVALNTDESIQAYKSKDRPIIALKYRLKMMGSLQFVDAVTWFHETDPIRLLGEIKPDVHVNGAEYGPECIEADVVKKNGGKVHIVNLIPSLSTSEIIKKIKSL